jgi:hypothetical protein
MSAVAIGRALRGVFTKTPGDKQIFGDELLAPIKSLACDRSTRFAFLTLISVALYSVVDKMAVSYIHPILFAFLHPFCGMCFYTPYIALTKNRDLIKKNGLSLCVKSASCLSF